MTPFVRDLENVESTTLAATHFKNRYIQQDQCFTCGTRVVDLHPGEILPRIC